MSAATIYAGVHDMRNTPPPYNQNDPLADSIMLAHIKKSVNSQTELIANSILPTAMTKQWLPPDDKWQYISREDGRKLGNEISAAQWARDMAWLAKQDYAEEHRAKPKREKQTMSERESELIAEDIRAWLLGPIELEDAQHSVAGKIVPTELPIEAHIILVKHNWAKVLDQSKIEGAGENIRAALPYPFTVFEFSFKGGVRAVFVGLENDEGKLHSFTWFKCKHGWLKLAPSDIRQQMETDPKHPLLKVLQLIDDNIQAICIMLEAEVAEATPMREPYRRNVGRSVGKPLPKLSHHVVSLARRDRLTPCDEHEPGTPKRLHFRRGHWRHYSNHRTWIKWMLVGNQDLGFVDKEYKL